MSTKDLIQKFLDLGITIGQAVATGTAPGTTFDWRAFLSSAEFAKIEDTVQALLNTFTKENLDGAIAELQAKKAAILNGRTAAALSGDAGPNGEPSEFDQYAAVNGALLVLTAQDIRNALDADALSVIAETVVPALKQVAPVLLPLLLAAA